MKRNLFLTLSFSLLVALVGLQGVAPGQGVEAKQTRQKAQNLMRQGNFKEAYEIFEKLCTSSEADQSMVSSDLTNAINCMNRLGNRKMFDALVEKSVKAHGENWRLLQTAAKQYMSAAHYGFIVSGEFERGQRRGNIGGSRKRQGLDDDRRDL